MKILITGGCGFVGSNLCLFLKDKIKNSEVASVDYLIKDYSYLNKIRLNNQKIKNYKLDIRKKNSLDKLKKFDVIIDCCAEPAVELSKNDIFNSVQTNLIGTLNVLEKVRKDKSKLIFLSSSRVYPILESNKKFNYLKKKFKRNIFFNENTNILGKKTIYGFSKISSEALIEEYNYLYDFKYIINRFGLITGSWQFGKVEQGLVSLWLWRHFKKKNLSYNGYQGTGSQIRDVLYIEDLCNLILLQIQSFDKIYNQVFCVGGSKKNAINLRQLTQRCQNITGNFVKIKKNKSTSIYDIPYFISSNVKVNKFYKWKPKYNLDVLLKNLYNWMLSNEKVINKYF